MYASDEAVVFVREHRKQTILVSATRGKDSDIKLHKDAIFGLEHSVNLFGGGKIDVKTNTVKLPGDKVSINVWRLPAAK